MDSVKKLQFVHAMTQQALHHAKTTPNVPTMDGKMSHEKMAAFVASQTKHGLQHFDTGGSVGTNAPAGQTTTGISQFGPPAQVTAPLNKVPVVGSSLSSAANPIGALQASTQNTFQAQGANIVNGTSADQLNTAYNQAQSGIGQQQTLANETMAGGTQGLNTQSNLSGQLAAQANGEGPNPAQNALNASTGQNIQQQAALMAGQRGAGGNAGLAAQNAARQGAATQQTAVGQSATLQSQQQLAAQSAEANLAAQQVDQNGQAISGLNTATQNEQNILQGANTAANNANVSMIANENNVNSQVSEGNQAASNNLMGGIMNGASSASSMFADGGIVQTNLGGGNYAAGSSTGGPSIGSSSPVTQGDPFAPSGGGKKDSGDDDSGDDSDDSLEAGATEESGGSADLSSALGSGMMMAARGGRVQRFDDGGDVQSNLGSSNYTASTDANGSASIGSSAPVNQGNPFASSGGGGGGGSSGIMSMLPMLAMAAAKGGKVPLDSYPRHLKAMHQMFHGGPTQLSAPVGTALKMGGQVPGKAVVNHDSYKNDTVPALLSPGEVVIDKDTLKRKDDIGKKARFLAQHLAKKPLRKKA